MKKVIAALRLAGINARQELTGIFRYLGNSSEWDIRVLADVQELSHELVGFGDVCRPDGIIIDATCPEDALSLLAKSRIPLVTMDLLPSRLNGRTDALRCIRCDDGGIGIAAARHFLSCGNFASFAFVPPTGQPRTWAQRRLEAFRFELSRHGHMCEAFEILPSDTPETDRRRLSNWIRKMKKPAAVFASWDYRARQVLEACRENRLGVPRQVAVLGVDNDELLCENSKPPLSSIIPDPETEGFLAAKTLDALMRGDNGASPVIRICKIKGVAQRESTSFIAPSAVLMRNAMAFIRKRFREPIGVTDIVRHLGVSRRLADKRFRETANESILEVLTRTRLEYLAAQLVRSRRPIKDLISAAGFGSLNQAKVLFRRKYGKSMREWRKSHPVSA